FVLLLFIGFIALRLFNLTGLPIFNDEAIYLDWGWRMLLILHDPFYSLYDAKPPLVLLLFGVAQTIFTSQLFAGRFVSVLFGLGTVDGLYLVGKHLGGKHLGLLSALLYVVIPLFTFFDRQALLESALCCVS